MILCIKLSIPISFFCQYSVKCLQYSSIIFLDVDTVLCKVTYINEASKEEILL
jgi:hypothetical protein